MFSVQCPRHGTEVLLTDDHIESLRRTDLGIELRWRCTCGEQGELTTGRPKRARAVDLAAC